MVIDSLCCIIDTFDFNSYALSALTSTERSTSLIVRLVFVIAAENTNSSCLPSEYPCANGVCIPRSAVCDGVSDCSKREDEDHCDCSDDEVSSICIRAIFIINKLIGSFLTPFTSMERLIRSRS